MGAGQKRALFYAHFKSPSYSDNRREHFNELARDLHANGWEIYTVGFGARHALASAEIPNKQMRVHGLMNEDDVAHSQQVHHGLERTIGMNPGQRERKGVVRFDLLCVALSPVGNYIAAGETPKIVREVYGDAPGTALLTTAAMGGRVLVVCDTVDYVGISDWIAFGMQNKSEVASVLAHKALGVAAHHLLECGSYGASAVCTGDVRVGNVRWRSRRDMAA